MPLAFPVPRPRTLAACAAAALLALAAASAPAQTATTIVTFNFDTASAGTPAPFTLRKGKITAAFTGGLYGYSIQAANVLGFTPKGLAGNCLYPNTVYASDVGITFNHAMTAIQMKFSPEEYATDSSATMQVSAYLGTTFVGSATAVAPVPGTWPTGTLKYATSTGTFDNVVVHYLKAPPTGGDYGPIFMLDVIKATLAP
jgi:hypothetical protein